jgi:hypothetical protein
MQGPIDPQALVAADLGDTTAACYATAVALTVRGSVEGAGQRGVEAAADLEKATEVIVDALKAVPDDKVQSAGYAELLLAYGKALLVHVRREMLSENVLSAGVEKEIKSAADQGNSKFIDVADGALDEDLEVVADKSEIDEDGAEEDGSCDDEPGDTVNGENHGADEASNDVQRERDGMQQDGDRKVKGEERNISMTGSKAENTAICEKEDPVLRTGETDIAVTDATEHAAADPNDEEEEDISTAELAWEQLEHARIIMENLAPGHQSRLSAVHEVQGDFLSETDGCDIRAADEYRKAAEAAIASDGVASRRVADLYHRRYLVLRKDEPVESIAAMERAIKAFKSFVDTGDGDDEDTETLDLMRQDLSVFKESLGSALTTVIGFGNKDSEEVLASGVAATPSILDSDEVTAVPREIIPVTVKPKRRAVAVAVSTEEPAAGARLATVSSSDRTDEPTEKRRKLASTKDEQA